MSNADAVAVALCAANGVIDKLELSTGVFGAMENTFLAHYQLTLASGPTSLSDDAIFTQMLSRYMSVHKIDLSKLGNG